ncbi:hypothetical protein [Pseudofulvibacter geojedonensis]|uniref:Anti-sigma factor n=1 Tax=Pseudofulvibacter geojedonensis TaxID=1123758 RepID=A0ABW3I1Z8_9FLAO
MFESDYIKNRFKEQEGFLDTEEPSAHHRDKFLKKLQQNEAKKANVKTNKKWWQYSVAAVFILSVGFAVLNMFQQDVTEEVVTTEHSKLPQEVVNIQFYMEESIRKELAKIELERNSDTEAIIEAAFKQLDFLEAEQKNIQEKLKLNYDKRLVKSLIDNFNYRVQLLENVMQQIEISKEITNNNQEYEVI